MQIGIITVQKPDYHPNRRLMEAARRAGHRATLLHPYRLWPVIQDGQLDLIGENTAALPQVVLPRQGAQIGDACLALIRQIQRLGTVLVNGPEAIAIARNKFLTQQTLTSAGLRCPDSVFINDAAGFFQAVERLGGYPVVAKRVSGRQGEGVLRIMNRQDARQRAMSTLDRRSGLIVQHYLPPERRRDLRALVVGGQLVCAAELFPPTDEFRANFHLGGDIRSTTLAEDLERTALGAAAATGCDVAGIDMMVDHDDRPTIVEVNYSPGFKGLEAATGLDIADRIVRFAMDRYHQGTK